MDPPFSPKQKPLSSFPVSEQNPPFRSFSHTKTSAVDISFSPNEISIFDAHKYFCHKSPPHNHALPRLSSGRRSFNAATPTASSEASWNSQTGLLVKPPDSVGVSLNNIPPRDHNNNRIKKTGKNRIFGRNRSPCCCAGTSSVRVKEANKNKANPFHTPERNTSISGDRQIPKQKKNPSPEKTQFPPPPEPPRLQRISASGRSFVDGAGGFSFPILKPGPNKAAVLKRIPSVEPPRDSLEVFQPNRVQFNSGSPLARLETTDDDMGSDASSDLFELESFSTQTTMYPVYQRDSLDEALKFNARRFAAANGINPNNSHYLRRSLDEAANEGYAPSEVSIDWSVTTAEGFDKGSVSNFSVSASEIGGGGNFRQEEGSGGKRKGNGGGLLMMSCRHGKAVSVGPQPVKCLPGEGTPPYVGGRPPRVSKATGMGFAA